MGDPWDDGGVYAFLGRLILIAVVAVIVWAAVSLISGNTPTISERCQTSPLPFDECIEILVDQRDSRR